jgi:hypothetical protein
MNLTTRRALTGISATLTTAGLVLAGAAAPAFAANNDVTDSCDADAGMSAISVSLAGYETIPEQPAYTIQELVSEAVAYVPAVYGPGPIITPAKAAVPAVYETQYEWDKAQGKSDPKWFNNDGPANPAVWVKTGSTRQFETSPAIPATAEVRGPDIIVTPEVPAQDAVYKPVVIPAVPGDDDPNSVTLSVDGDVVFTADFGAAYARSVPIDGAIAHTYSVVVEAAGSTQGAEIEGTVDACAKAGPIDPTDPTDPTEPVDPTDPTDPTEPVDPTDPTDPSEPVDPTDPTDPTVPVDPADPTTPAEPTAPAAPAVPVSQVKPSVPAKPASTVTPAGTKITSLASTGTSPWTVPALLGAVMMGLAGAAAVSTGRRARRA